LTLHFAGAGTAVIFSMILRSRIEKLRKDGADRLRVLAFASPPILDYEASKNCQSFVTTFINNSDIIPRSSISNLVVLLHVMKTVNRRLDEQGLSPRDMKSTATFLKWLMKGKHEEMIFKPEEIKETLDEALDKAKLDDPDHLFVGGRVVHMFDEWTKKDYGNKSDYEDAGDEIDESKKVPTAEKVYVADGAAKMLRIIEIDDRMMSDHMSAGYRASIRALLDKADKIKT
jgi:Lipase (class 3)